MTYNEIIKNLFVGDFEDAILFRKQGNANILCVLEFIPTDEPVGAMHIGFLNQAALGGDAIKAEKGKLNSIAAVIDAHLKNNNKLLVHCAAGLERSPLAVVYYLHKYHNKTIEEAYNIVKEKRPQIIDRRIWLETK